VYTSTKQNSKAQYGLVFFFPRSFAYIKKEKGNTKQKTGANCQVAKTSVPSHLNT
jgi:hypothetical protein